MLNDGFFVSPSDHYAKTTVKVIYAGDKNSVTECGPKPACEINECMKNNEFQNLLIYVHTPEKGEFRSKVTTSCPPRMYIDAPKPSLDSGNTCAYAKKSSKRGVLNPEDMHFNRTPRTTPESETEKPSESEKPSEPKTEASTEATKETEPETTKATKETEAPKPPKPRNPDRVKPTEPTKETEPETVKPTEPASPSEIERSIPKNSKPSTPIPPATPSKPKITMHKNGEVRGNHRDPVDEKHGEVYGSNRPFYVDENGEKVYYTDRTVHTGDERNMRRNMLLMLSAFGLLVLYGTMRFLKKLDVE